jgi:WD40 repeat protein
MKHEGAIHGAIFSKDEIRILSWSEDNTLRLWDAATSQQIGPAMKHDAAVYGALFSKNEGRILSWSEDNTLRLWNPRWPPGSNLLQIACSLLPDHSLADLPERYGISVSEPICSKHLTIARPDWSRIERAYAE